MRPRQRNQISHHRCTGAWRLRSASEAAAHLESADPAP